MKTYRFLLLLAACLLTAGVALVMLDASFDQNGMPVLFEDEDEFCVMPEVDGKPEWLA